MTVPSCAGQAAPVDNSPAESINATNYRTSVIYWVLRMWSGQDSADPQQLWGNPVSYSFSNQTETTSTKGLWGPFYVFSSLIDLFVSLKLRFTNDLRSKLWAEQSSQTGEHLNHRCSIPVYSSRFSRPHYAFTFQGHSQNAWANGGSNHGGMNYPSRQQQWPGQMSMPPAQQWGYPQQSTQWQMQQQQVTRSISSVLLSFTDGLAQHTQSRIWWLWREESA